MEEIIIVVVYYYGFGSYLHPALRAASNTARIEQSPYRDEPFLYFGSRDRGQATQRDQTVLLRIARGGGGWRLRFIV